MADLKNIRRNISTYYNIPKVNTTYNYVVVMEFPFNVKTLDVTDFLNISAPYRTFNRRLTAERCRMNALKDYYGKLGNMLEYKNWFDRYNNIEEEHPEWLI